MAKRTTIESEKQPTGKEIRLPAKTTIKTFDAVFDDVKGTVDTANEALKTAADEAKAKHLNLWAYKTAKKLYDDFHAAENDALAAEKLAIKLSNFDECRKYFGLDEIANLQGRLFGEGEIGAGGKVTDVNGVEREVDEDGEPDPRPSHLRREGASAATVEPDAPLRPNPVQDLAEKTGAKVQPIDQVGRGKPH